MRWAWKHEQQCNWNHKNNTCRDIKWKQERSFVVSCWSDCVQRGNWLVVESTFINIEICRYLYVKCAECVRKKTTNKQELRCWTWVVYYLQQSMYFNNKKWMNEWMMISTLQIKFNFIGLPTSPGIWLTKCFSIIENGSAERFS